MEDLISVADVATELKVSQQHVRSLIRKELLKGERVGSQWVTTHEFVEDYVNRNGIIIEPDDHKRKDSALPDFVALSFFSGAMGLDIGMEKEGISPLLACEIDKETRKTIHANKPDIALIGDLADYSAEEVLEYARIPKNHPIDLIYGGPPCQAFSTAGKRRGFEDDRGNIFLNFIKLIGDLKPNYALIENVRGLLSARYPLYDGGEPVKGGALYFVVKKLEEYGYSVSFELYNSANFGAPQIRERVIIICKLGKNKVPYLQPTHSQNSEDNLKPWKTLGEALEGLDPKKGDYVEYSEKRLKYFEMLGEGQNWRDLPEDIQPLAMGKSYSLGGGRTGFYRRLNFSKPSPTLVTHPTMPATDLCHPTENRPLSVQEYKRIQGFPDDWKFCGKVTDIYRQIGNAVPIELGRAAARAILADRAGESQPQELDFKFSRYKETDEISFMNKMEQQTMQMTLNI